MSNSVEPKADTRTRILQATWRLLEKPGGQPVRMQDIAKEAGVSRQAVYMHFGSRTDLLVATTHYVDQQRGGDERLRRWEEAPGGVERLEEWIDFWGHYIPDIHPLGKALLLSRETDEAAAAAWDERMGVVRRACRETVEALAADNALAPHWSVDKAADLLWTVLSIQSWEQLVVDSGWSTHQYVRSMQALLKDALVAS